MRELTRFRTTLVRERAREVNRIQKTLEGANLKLGDVASDVLGTSGRAILDAMVDGTTDTATLADLAQGRLRDKRASLQRGVDSRRGEHQRFGLDPVRWRVWLGGEGNWRTAPFDKAQVERRGPCDGSIQAQGGVSSAPSGAQPWVEMVEMRTAESNRLARAVETVRPEIGEHLH